ncbi:hypothetical protein CES87_18665 [Pseudomonas sp. ERMR1:02]|nr:hypothetical protein CES87_18665 [Pseudomonas sp. ERMR1:02]
MQFDMPRGQAAAYYPETNPLAPLDSYGHRTYTPTSKSVAIKVVRPAVEAGGPLDSSCFGSVISR